jgi:hypothetical protein
MHNAIKPKKLLSSLVLGTLMASGTFFTLNIIGELFSREKDFIRIAVWLFLLTVYFLLNYTDKTDRFLSVIL